MNHILVNKDGDEVYLQHCKKYANHILVINKYHTKEGDKAKARISDCGNMNILIQVYQQRGYKKAVQY